MMPAVGVIGIIMMMILPVPAFLLDLALVTSIALSLTILIVSLYVKEVLDFSAFPSVLLFATLFRLALNVASARLILLHGEEGASAAGHVIEAFGQFVVARQLTRSGSLSSSFSSSSISSSSPKAPAASPKWRRASLSIRCRASRWPSTPISTPA